MSIDRQISKRINHLKRVIAVQEFYQSIRVEGQPDAYVWRQHIYPRFHICLNTFYQYLQLPAQKELNKLLDGHETALSQTQTRLFE